MFIGVGNSITDELIDFITGNLRLKNIIFILYGKLKNIL